MVSRVEHLSMPSARTHAGVYFAGVSDHWASTTRLAAKRAIDIVGALVLLLLFAPLLLIITLMVGLDNGWPVFFRQQRPGRGGEHFGIVKFRTMRRDAQEQLRILLTEDPESRREWATHQKLRNDPRVSRLGRALRRTSLDELPQLFNVLRGDMSLVGPRPVVGDPSEVFGPYTSAVLHAKPGLTGMWAISGRHACEDSRADLEYSYVSSWSLAMDLRILARTPWVVLSAEGAW
jgi:exopolysaccharide production protein ExoY